MKTAVTIAGMPLASYTVVHAADALPGIVAAAHAIAETAVRTFGVTLSVVSDAARPGACEIVLGDTNRPSPAADAAKEVIRHDGFALVMDGTRLHIIATTGRGVAYGAYALMEDYFGARFYDSRYRVFHPQKAVDVPADLCRVDNPGFMARDTFWYDFLNPATGEAAEGFDFIAARRNNAGALSALGGGVSYAGGLVHTLPALAGTAHEPGVQPCLTDEAVYETVRGNVRRWLDENPTATIISVSQNDSYAEQLGCQCPNCRAIDEREGTPMGSLLTFVNRIADDIKDDYPHVWVDTLAYRYTRKAPKTVKPADNVIIRLCSIECCFSHSLDDPDCPRNVAFVEDIKAWSAICDHLYIWDYTTDFLYYIGPFPNFAVLRENVRFFGDNHVIGMFEQGNYQSVSGEFGELRGYLLARLLWDPTMTEAAYNNLMDEFLADYYGEGWPFVRRYIDLTSEIAAHRHLGIYDHPHAILPFTDPDGKEDATLFYALLDLWDKALAAASEEPHRVHIRKSRIQSLCLSTFAPEGLLAADLRARLLSDMHAAIRESDVTYFREGSRVPTDPDPENLPLLH